MPRIKCLYAFVAEDSGPDDEGLCAMKIGTQWMPLVGADMARAESLRPIAQAIAKDTNKKVKLLHFTTRKDVEVIA